jgi:SPASM domain peptide maturase of grasp-with-spasm system
MKNKYIKLFASCKLVQGYSRSTICDLERGAILTLPNDIVGILDDAKSNTVNAMEVIYDKEVLGEYLQFLINNELAFCTDEPDSFPEISTEYFTPTIIHNSVIAISEYTKGSIDQITNDLKKLHCRFIELRIHDTVDVDYLDKLLNALKESPVQNVSIYSNYSANGTAMYEILMSKHAILGFVVLFDKAESNSYKDNNRILVAKGTLDDKNCGMIDAINFTSNLPTHNLSVNYNSCLYQKIAIDTEGNIKNCPSMAKSYGNIRDTKLIDVVNNLDFQKVWHIKKDEITKCKDCEFRHVCTDCRTYIENPEDQYAAPLKCGYNPYTCEWEEWSANPLKQQAIEYYGMEDLVKR